MGHLYIISGSSGSGKTTLVDNAVTILGLNAARAKKYSERPSRGPADDVIHVDRIEDASCDLVYVINDNYYGVNTQELDRQLEEGKNVFIVLSDFRVIEQLKEKFGSRASAIYVSSSRSVQQVLADRNGSRFNPSEEETQLLFSRFYGLQCAAQLERWPTVFQGMVDLLSEWSHVVPDAESSRIRQEKVRTFHIRYVDQPMLFDHVILNDADDDPSDMTRQIRHLVSTRNAGLVRQPAEAPLFVVAAPSGAGKALLMETMRRVFGGDVKFVEKHALRDAKPGDGRDGMVALGSGGVFDDHFDFRWSFHGDASTPGVQYAISTSAVRATIEAGLSQIVVSNVGTFPRFREKFGSHVVFVYLHATRPESEVREYQYRTCATAEEAERRIHEIREVHESYMDHIGDFHHVLLNTSHKEDLFDQMLHLLQHYKRRASIRTSGPTADLPA